MFFPRSLPLNFANAQQVSASYTITKHIVEHGFPLEFLLAGELAQMETFAIPRISKLLHRTKQYEQDGLKRLDDTKATMYGIFSNEPDGQARKQMVEHLNWVHSHYDIHNDDNIYTLIRMFMHPIEWIEKWGRRPLNTTEKEAFIQELVRISHEMKIKDMPTSFEQVCAWQKQYRDQNQRFDPANHAVAVGMINAIELHFPKVLRPAIKPLILTLLDNETLVKDLGFRRPNKHSQLLGQLAIRMWKLFSRAYNPWQTRAFSDSWLMNYYPSYQSSEFPNGLELCKMGPRKLIQSRDKKNACPFH